MTLYVNTEIIYKKSMFNKKNKYSHLFKNNSKVVTKKIITKKKKKKSKKTIF